MIVTTLFLPVSGTEFGFDYGPQQSTGRSLQPRDKNNFEGLTKGGQ